MTYESIPLGDIVDIVGGGTPDKSNHCYWGGAIPWATVKDLKHATLETTQDYITDEGLKGSTSRIVPAGSIIFATRMAVGKAAISSVDMAINQDLKAIFCKDKLDTNYLFHFLNSKTSYFKKKGKGATVKGIVLSDIKELSIPLPPLPEQKRIAAILDKADAIRKKRKNALELADQFLKSVFLDMFGDPVTNPKGWKEAPLSAIADIASGVTKGKAYIGKELVQIPYMRVANVQDGNIDLSEIKEIVVSRDDAARYTLNDGDVLLTEGGDPDKLGRGAVWHGQITPCIHQNHIFRVRADKRIVYPEYLSLLIGSLRGKRYFLKAAKQTTGIASINMSQLKSFPVLLPSIDVQSKFMETQRVFIKKQKQLLTSCDHAENLFSSVASRAFSGEL